MIATALIYGTGTGPLATLSPGTISTVAGNGTAGYNGSGTASSAQLNAAQGIVVDAGGNLFLADTASNRVLKISGSTITSYAGGGTGGNGGPATSASLSGPVALSLDGAGNLYILESTAQDVRVVTLATGIISAYTSAALGNNAQAMVLDTAGNVYVALTGLNMVAKVTPSGTQTGLAGLALAGYTGDGGLAATALLNAPAGIGLDAAGNVYIADTGNNRIRKITTSSGIISTVAGSSSTAGFSGDGGAATAALLSAPRGQILFDAAGNLYFADSGNNRVRVVSAATAAISTLAGSANTALGDAGPANAAQLNVPLGLALDTASNLYISDSSNERLRKVTATPAPLTFAVTQVNSTSSDSPRTVTLNNTGNVALTLAVPGSGINPAVSAGYALGSGTCPQISASGSAGPLAAGASCTQLISFKPTVVSSTNSGSLTITDNSGNVTGNTWTAALSGVSTGTVTTASLALNPASGVLTGGNVVLNATITPSTATGSVIFYDNGVAVSAALAVSGGTASYTDAALTMGGHSFTAAFTGTGVYAASTSSAQALTVTTATTTAVTLNPAARVITGQTVTLTATLTPSAGSGSVIFSDNGTAISTAIPVSNGVASYSDANIAIGNHSFTAAFTGSAGYNNSNSSAALLLVTGPVANLLVTGIPSASANGVVESYTVTAVDAAGNIVTGFTGAVSTSSTDPLATWTDVSPYTFTAADNGVHTFNVTFGTAGTQSVTAATGSISGSQTGITVGDTLVIVNSNGTASQLSGNGAAISPTTGYTGGGAPTSSVAVDSSGSFFSLTPGSNVLAKFSRTGTALSGSGFTGGGLSSPSMLAVDGSGQVWITNTSGGVSLFSNAGTALSPATGLTSGGYSNPTGIAIDISGDVWVANSGNNTLTEILGAASPVAPLSTAVTNVNPGARP